MRLAVFHRAAVPTRIAEDDDEGERGAALDRGDEVLQVGVEGCLSLGLGQGERAAFAGARGLVVQLVAAVDNARHGDELHPSRDGDQLGVGWDRGDLVEDSVFADSAARNATEEGDLGTAGGEERGIGVAGAAAEVCVAGSFWVAGPVASGEGIAESDVDAGGSAVRLSETGRHPEERENEKDPHDD